MPEQALADSLGIPRGILTNFRRPGGEIALEEHWRRDAGARVVYTPTGIDAVRRLLGLPPTSPEKKEKGAAEDYPLRIHRFTKNPRIIEAKDASGSTVRVRIQHQHKKRLAPGMQIHARPVGDPANGLFELQIQRTPHPSQSPLTEA